MFWDKWFKKNKEQKNDNNAISELIKKLTKNEIEITTGENIALPNSSKFGGKPYLPKNFEWPRFEAENFENELANRPLSFLCQINLEETAKYDTNGLLPKTGMLYFFYDIESERWGFDPEDNGCAKVYYFDSTDSFEPIELPSDLNEIFIVPELSISFKCGKSIPSYEELEIHDSSNVNWEEYDNLAQSLGYNLEIERHKLLGYANLVQNEALTECERITRGLYCGDSKSYQETSDEENIDIYEKASGWILLFQMSTIEKDGFEIMWGDCGCIYFYIKKDDLKNKRFDKVWLVLQCG